MNHLPGRTTSRQSGRAREKLSTGPGQDPLMVAPPQSFWGPKLSGEVGGHLAARGGLLRLSIGLCCPHLFFLSVCHARASNNTETPG